MFNTKEQNISQEETRQNIINDMVKKRNSIVPVIGEDTIVYQDPDTGKEIPFQEFILNEFQKKYPHVEVSKSDIASMKERGELSCDGMQGNELNMFDIYDMSGNVSELCNTPYDDQGRYTICGGNYDSSASKVTVSSRDGFRTDERSEKVGFRLVVRRPPLKESNIVDHFKNGYGGQTADNPILTKTGSVNAGKSTKYSSFSKGHQDLVVKAEHGGLITLKIHVTNSPGLDKRFDDVVDVRKGRQIRTASFDLPSNLRNTVEVEVINCTQKDISFVVFSN